MPSPSREIYGFAHQTASLSASMHPQLHQCCADVSGQCGSICLVPMRLTGAPEIASTRASRRRSAAIAAAIGAPRPAPCSDAFRRSSIAHSEAVSTPAIVETPRSFAWAQRSSRL